MRFESISLLALVAAASAAPYGSTGSSSSTFPSDGFPNPDAKQLKDIEVIAGGTLSNKPPPPNPNSKAFLGDLKVIAFNELFEVAFFNSLFYNVSNNVPGYEVSDSQERDLVLDTLKTVIAQEELHTINANNALKAFGSTPIVPAEYMFPVDNLKDALNFAATFTELVLGALQNVLFDIANSDAHGLVEGVGSIIGQEGEQTGFYRVFNKLVPSSSPFLTNTAGKFGFNALLQNVIVPGSDKKQIDLPVFDVLTILSTPQAKNSTLKFQSTADPSKTPHIAYISGQNVPVVVPISNVQSSHGVWTFEADFPFDSGFSKGLTVSALTSTAGPFANATEVADKTVAGPGLITVD